MNHYVLIKPNADLQALLAQNRHISMPPELFYVEEDGRPTLSFDDGIEARKLFYLAGLYEYMQLLAHSKILRGLMTEEEQERKYQFYRDLLGDPPYTRKLFDRWWSIERISLRSNYTEKFKDLPVSALDMLEERESERLAGWLRQQIQWKKDKLDGD